MQPCFDPQHHALEAWEPRLAGPPSDDLAALIAESESASRELTELLETLGYRVLSFTSPGTAASVLAGMRPRLLVAARAMSADQAARICEATRGRWGRPGRVAVTDRLDRMTRCERALYDAIACKPVCATDFAGAVHRAVASAMRAGARVPRALAS